MASAVEQVKGLLNGMLKQYTGEVASLKVLVTGGAGFIGSNLVGLIMRKGHQVVVLDNLLSGYLKNLEPFPEVEFVEGDIRDEKALQRVMQGIDVVFHLAAAVGNKRSIENPMQDAEINVLGTLKVLEAARKAGVRKVIFSSSAGIFGELIDLPIRESHPVEPDSPYGADKLAAEKLCLAYGKLYGFEVACLRYFNVYGVNQRYDAYGNVIPIFVHQMLRGETVTIFGDGKQTRDFVNVSDVAAANYLAAVTPGAVGPFNIASGSFITIVELFEVLQEVSGSRAHLNYGPPRKGDVRDSVADISRARQYFGYQPTVTLAHGLREYVEWAKKELAL